MLKGQSEAFSHVLIDRALVSSEWNLLDPREVRFEINGQTGRADYVLLAQRGGALCVLEAIASHFTLRCSGQKWLDATAQLLAEDSTALKRFMSGDITIFTANQFRTLGGLDALTRFEQRDEVFEALRQSTLVRQSMFAT